MSSQQDINAFRAQRIANTLDSLALMANTQTTFHPDQPSPCTYIQHPQPNNNFVQQPSFNMNYMQQPMQTPEDISDPTIALDMALKLIQITLPGMNTSQDIQMLMVDDNRFTHNTEKTVGIQSGRNVVQNVRKIDGISVDTGIANQYRIGNVVSARAEVKPRKQNAAYLQKHMQIAQKEEAGIQLTSKEFEFMAAAGAYEETKKVTANCNLQVKLQQASTSGTQSDKAPVYDSDESAEYTDLLEPIPEPLLVQQNDSNVISDVPCVEQNGGTVEQCPVAVEESRTLYDSLYNKLAIEVENVNSVNRNLKAKIDELTTLARYKIQENCFEISQEKYDKLEMCYQQSVYQEQCLTKKINTLHLSSGKQITALNEEISNLNKQLSMEKSTVSSLLEEKKRLKSDFKIREDELLDKQILLENKIKELDNILVKTGQSIQTMHMLSPKPDSFYHTEQKMALGYQNPFYLYKKAFFLSKLNFKKHSRITLYRVLSRFSTHQPLSLSLDLLRSVEVTPRIFARP
ncbi:hypothetical protein Tco_1387778 [Tanacetum coccineum]